MKKIISGILTVTLVLSLLTATAFAAGAGTVVYRNTQQLADNLNYTETISYINNTERQSCYELGLTGGGDAYPIIMACDTIYGRMTVEQMVAYAGSQGKNVLAAVNTDFFSMQTGVPLGLVVEDGVYKSSPEQNTAVAFKPDGSVYFSSNPEVAITLLNSGSASDMTNSGQTAALTHFNKFRTNTGGLYLFSSAFSSVSTRTSTPGWFVRFKILSGTPAVTGTMTLEVAETLTSDTAVPIGDGYLVLTAASGCGLESEFTKFKAGDLVTMTTACSDPTLNDARWATGGGDILIKDSAITDQTTWDKAISPKNPRTALGVKDDGTIVTYVYDGRESDHSAGLTLKSLAEEMLARGCVSAVNLDGGGSSVISVRRPGLQTSAVQNRPSDGFSRKSGAYLLFVTDKVSDGKAKYLYLQNDGPVILAGSSVNMSYLGMDAGFKPAAAPNDVTAVSSGLGAVSGMTYKAGPVHGVDKVMLSSPSTGAAGYGTMHIIYDPTDLKVTANGGASPVTSLTVWPGDTIQLAASAFYCGLPVISDSSATKYAAVGDIGTVSETGLFTTGSAAGVTGSVTITIGGKTVAIPVTVAGFSDVAVDHWAKPSIKGLTEQGVIAGTTATTYAPDQTIRRCDFVLMLWRAAGKPTAITPTTFTDIMPEDYYAAAVAWAEAVGIAQGDGSGLFNPTGTLTREQAFTFLYRALDDLKISFTDALPDCLSAFGDRDSLSGYAVTPTATLVTMGIVTGAYGNLSPSDAITRAGMAKILFEALG
jgi:exopolysaccharide biosynthesis protein